MSKFIFSLIRRLFTGRKIIYVGLMQGKNADIPLIIVGRTTASAIGYELKVSNITYYDFG